MKYSIIVPVYNRPDEVDELLQSLTEQELKDFEVVIVEDGSQKPCKDVCDKFADILDLHYYVKENGGPGQARNYGAERAKGEWLIILDSDVVLPKGYLQAVENGLSVECRVESVEFAAAKNKAEASSDDSNHNSTLYTLHSTLAAFGGPDASHPSFTPIQKAISYSMTSFFTTGGIRGGKKKLDKFYPRSFNMGIRRDVYLKLGGFSKMRFGEDIDFSYRIVEAGYNPQLFPDAWVWHKRRTDFRKFFRQVYNSGIARINLEKRHPGTLKLVHLLRRSRYDSLRCTQLAHLVLDLPGSACTRLFLQSHHFHRLQHQEQELESGTAEHSRSLCTTDGIRLRLHRILVETMRAEERRVPSL